MLVNEIFDSIEGEGIRTGCPVTFIRLYGCNLRCSYCDSMYAVDGKDYHKMSIDAIVQRVKDFGWHRVTLTGGEPLVHKDVELLITQLTDAGFEVNIETNGAVFIGTFTEYLGKDGIFTVDYKTPSSGMCDKMVLDNFKFLREKDVLKFVVGSEKDLTSMKCVLDSYKPKCNIFVSPVFGKIEPRRLVEFVSENRLENCRVQLQIHKFIWDPNARGV